MSRSASRLGVLVRERLEQFRGSLFGVPALGVLVAVIGATASTEVDRRLDAEDLPTLLTTTVDSARALLGAITSGTISAASVVFSLTLVAVQLSTSTYSSRVVRTFLRDRFQQRVIALVMGTFAYSMLVLRAVRGPLEEGGSEFVPRLSIIVATLLALASLLALIASINHTAQNLRVSTITRGLVDEIKAAIDRCLPRDPEDAAASDPAGGAQPYGTRAATGPPVATEHGAVEPLAQGAVLTAPDAGWVRQISLEVIRSTVAEGSTVRLEVAPGNYVFADAPLLTVWPPPTPDELDEQQENLRGAFSVGGERSLQQDLIFGLVLLEDIAVRALSPGVNDPNTAREVIPQIGELLLDILSRPLPPIDEETDLCQILRPAEADYRNYVAAGFDQLRRCSAGQTEVVASLITTTRTVGAELRRRGQGTREAFDALHHLVDRLADDVRRFDLPATDRTRLRDLIDDIDWHEPDDGTDPQP